MDERDLKRIAMMTTIAGLLLILAMTLFQEPDELNPFEEPDPLGNRQRQFTGELIKIRHGERSSTLTLRVESRIDVIAMDPGVEFSPGSALHIRGTVEKDGKGLIVFADEISVR